MTLALATCTFLLRPASYTSHYTEVALGGSANDYHAQNEGIFGRYLAGVWSGTLIEGLLWHTSTYGHLRPPRG
jgi:hypothetical protein